MADKNRQTATDENTDAIIRGFYALVVLIIGVSVAFFVFTNSQNPEANRCSNVLSLRALYEETVEK